MHPLVKKTKTQPKNSETEHIEAPDLQTDELNLLTLEQTKGTKTTKTTPAEISWPEVKGTDDHQ